MYQKKRFFQPYFTVIDETWEQYNDDTKSYETVTKHVSYCYRSRDFVRCIKEDRNLAGTKTKIGLDRGKYSLPEDIKIQTMLSKAIKRIIKHHHKSLKECVSRAQLMCGDLSLVHSLIQVFSYGFKSAPMRPSPSSSWSRSCLIFCCSTSTSSSRAAAAEWRGQC